jgi:hypothetical protein
LVLLHDQNSKQRKSRKSQSFSSNWRATRTRASRWCCTGWGRHSWQSTRELHPVTMLPLRGRSVGILCCCQLEEEELLSPSSLLEAIPWAQVTSGQLVVSSRQIHMKNYTYCRQKIICVWWDLWSGRSKIISFRNHMSVG